MSNLPKEQLTQMETTCGSLLYELQIIWDEVGESDAERDRLLLELEQECLEVYRRKVDQANRSRAQLRQAIADSEAELAAICSTMGERPVHLRQAEQNTGSLKEELRAIVPQVEEMRKRKNDRLNQFKEVLEQIQKISKEIFGPGDYKPSNFVVDETDLSMRKLDELHGHLLVLQKEKSDRLKQVLDHISTLNSLCIVLGMDFKHTVAEVHPSLYETEGSKSISDDTIERLAFAIQRFREIKIQRMQKLQDLATTMLELWNLMDTPIEEQQMFQNVTCNIAASEHEITEPGTLSEDFINYVEAEVLRLEELKASKMKELVLKKRSELEEICRRTHLVAETDTSMEYAIEAIETGTIDPSCVLEQIEAQIAKVKDEAFSRKEILEKVEKWLAACEEESWLEEYNRDDNRYNAGRGAHLTLKRAEKARALVAKLPAMVEALASKTTAWEKERGVGFNYDGDQKKLQGQLIAEQEALFGSKPSPSKQPSSKKVPRVSTGNANRRLSLGGASLQPQKLDSHHAKHGSAMATPASRPIRKDDGPTALAAGRKGLDVGDLPLKKHPSNAIGAYETEVPMIRQPFSPVTAFPSQANVANALEELNIAHNKAPVKVGLSNNMLSTTPSKQMFVTDEENRNPMATPMPAPRTPSTVSAAPMPTTTTPGAVSVPLGARVTEIPPATPKEMPILAPATPSTVSVPMQTSMTPAVASIPFETRASQMEEDIEYSFEERRLGFIVPRMHLKPVHL
ncbi:Microtubule-associated protein [Cinnamomum micranthum f. kanehirae]|uniref:Microtubule-associated protein n=1 Tax=Cinnamomum micranthum f. kanehirae TaxID=337451 RepID=A0A443P9C0_9MAGN|nr:Microtubule-associated protein [Cinnamomum micranthum f. kanehirae]